MASALKLLKRHGYRRIRLEDVAENAGVCKAARAGGSAADRLGLFLREFWTMSLSTQAGLWQRLVVSEMATDAPDVFAAWARGLVQRWRLVEGLIKEGQDSGEFRRSADAEVMARMIVSGLQHQALFEIDRRPFEAVLAQTRAQLAEAEAQVGKTERDQQRDRPLAEQRAIAQSQLDNDIQANLAAQAAVKSATAAVASAQLNVGFTRVTSPIDGVAAIATAQIGDLVGPTTLLTTVSQIDPIKAYFPLSEQEYLRMAGRINTRGARGPGRAAPR